MPTSDDLDGSDDHGSTSMERAIAGMKSGFWFYVYEFDEWIDENPLYSLFVMAFVGTAIGRVVFWASKHIYITYHGRKLGLELREVWVESFPAPVGFTMTILAGALVVVTVFSFVKVASLRKRVEALESQLED